MATLTAHADLPVGDHTVRDARTFSLAATAAWECEVSIETLLLLVDELAGAVRERASGEHDLLLTLSAHDGRGIRVTLADGNAVRAAAAAVVEGAPALAALLATLAARWGHEPYRGGYSLWFELDPVEPDARGGSLRADGSGVDIEVEVEAHLRRHRAAAPAASPPLDASAAARLDAWFARGTDPGASLP
jgi:hypothetical protein